MNKFIIYSLIVSAFIGIIVVDVFFNPIFSLSILVLSSLYWLKNTIDYIYILIFIQLIEDVLLMRPLGLTVGFLIIGFYLMVYLNEKYLFYEHKYIQIILFIFVFIVVSNFSLYIWYISTFNHLDLLFISTLKDLLINFLALFAIIGLGSYFYNWFNKVGFLFRK